MSHCLPASTLFKHFTKNPIKTDDNMRTNYVIYVHVWGKSVLLTSYKQTFDHLTFLHIFKCPLCVCWFEMRMMMFSTGLPVVLSEEREAVLVGAAVLGACASSDYSSIQVHYTQPCISQVFIVIDSLHHQSYFQEILSAAFLGSNEEHEQNRACGQT